MGNLLATIIVKPQKKQKQLTVTLSSITSNRESHPKR